ncbi:MAG: glutamate-5-semialdehyde dehydrogenase [Gammaproteobacteria bacterium]|nr:glutamate-5-semialdehyde dehydrogenase [Gammaproteobacteria bacterium]
MDTNLSVLDSARCARASSGLIATAPTAIKNGAIKAIARIIREETIAVANANLVDIEHAQHNGISQPLLDRLRLDESGIERMCQAAEAVAALPDPVGELSGLHQQPSGIRVGRMRIPLGVFGMIYESRPNVTLEAASLAIKSGNACILRGGSEAIRTNCAIADCITRGLEESGLPAEGVQLVRTTDRSAVGEMLAADEFIDLIVPRGGKGLIERVSRESTIPVLKHLDGVCHVYIDDSADDDLAVRIAINSKAEKYSVCNAAETLLIAFSKARTVLPNIAAQFADLGVEMRGCERTRAIVPNVALATEQDWYEEYLDAVIAVKLVDDIDEAIAHISKYGSAHTDTIVATDLQKTQQFINQVDSASVMVNTSTQFADGFEFGLGAEIGISTDKLHARGPVGLEGLTTQKFVVYSDGAIRHR